MADYTYTIGKTLISQMGPTGPTGPAGSVSNINTVGSDGFVSSISLDPNSKVLTVVKTIVKIDDGMLE